MSDGTYIESLVKHTKPDFTTVDHEGKKYSDKRLIQIKPDAPVRPETLSLSRLDALIDYIAANVDKIVLADCLLHIVHPNEILLLSRFSDDDFKQRSTYVKVTGPGCQFKFGEYYDQENFILSLQTKFQETTDRNSILQLVSNIVTEESITSNDDGYSQSVVVRHGTVKVQAVQVPRLLTLKPHRTFMELETQPESKFLIRLRQDSMKHPQISLLETDGGDWKLQAVRAIAEVLDGQVGNIPILS